VLVVVYMDDIVVTGNNSADIQALKAFLHEKFKIKDLGELHYFLGMELLKVPNGLIMTQKKFTMDLLKDFQCDTLTPTSYPLVPFSKASFTEDAPADATAYRKLVGKLNYLTNTRPDLTFSVQYLSQFHQTPSTAHMAATIHTLRYLKKDPSLGLFFNNSEDYNLQAYCDSDWA